MSMRAIDFPALGLAVFAAGLTTSLLAPSPAFALDDTKQLLTGGNSLGGASPVFTAPGLGNIYGLNFPKTNDGERAAQVRMPAGTLGLFRVQVRTEKVPTSGILKVTVRLNGLNTALGCQVSSTGTCSTGATTVAVADDDKLAIRVENTLVDPGFTTFSYSMTFD